MVSRNIGNICEEESKENQLPTVLDQPSTSTGIITETHANQMEVRVASPKF